MHVQMTVCVHEQNFPLKKALLRSSKGTCNSRIVYQLFSSVGVYLFPRKDQITITLVKQNCVVNKILKYEKYPAQMLEVAGDLRRAPAKFENPEHWTCDL